VRPFEEDVQIMLDSLVGRTVFTEVPEAIEQLRKRYRVVIGSTTDTAPLLENMKSNKLMVDRKNKYDMLSKVKPDYIVRDISELVTLFHSGVY